MRIGVVFPQTELGGDVRAAEKDRKVTRVFPQGDRDGEAVDAPRAVAESAK